MDSESASSESASVSHSWTVAEAKAHLSHILRRAEAEGLQRIGRQRTYIVVPERLWKVRSSPEVSLGRWLVDHMPRDYELESPGRRSDRDIPFSDASLDAP